MNVHHYQCVRARWLTFGLAEMTEAEAAKKVPENPWQNMVDLKRANNIGIMLSHLKISLNQLYTAIMHLDENILSREKVTQLLKNLGGRWDADTGAK